MAKTIEELERRIGEMERSARRSRLGFAVGLGAMALASCAAMAQQEAPAAATMQDAGANVIRARGIIIEDEAGRPRILLGAPAPAVAGRTRRDALTGMVYLDENGADRVTLGAWPDPMMASGISRRRTGGAGMLIHDRDGIERGGYGVLDDSMAVLTLDWPRSGEGVALMSNEQFSAMALYNYSRGPSSQALMLGTSRTRDGGGYITLNNGDGKQRMTLHASGTNTPQLISWNREQREVSRRNFE